MHMLADTVECASGLPVLHVADASCLDSTLHSVSIARSTASTYTCSPRATLRSTQRRPGHGQGRTARQPRGQKAEKGKAEGKCCRTLDKGDSGLNCQLQEVVALRPNRGPCRATSVRRSRLTAGWRCRAFHTQPEDFGMSGQAIHQDRWRDV